MKLIRFGKSGQEKPGVQLDDGTRLDCSGFGEDYDESFFENDGTGRLQQWLSDNQASCEVVPPETRLGAPLARPSKIICIGLNFKDHAEESGMTPPTEPVVFFKATSAIVGPNDDLVLPRNAEKVDWEVELAVVVGKKASYVEEADAMDYVLGYCNINDVSARDFQFADGQWQRGKSCETFCPTGPFIATADEIEDPHNLRIQFRMNGNTLQDSSTKQLIFNIPQLIAYLSGFVTLEPGDLISTGTPPGVGFARKPPIYIQPGDVMEVEVEGLGILRNPAVAAD